MNLRFPGYDTAWAFWVVFAGMAATLGALAAGGPSGGHAPPAVPVAAVGLDRGENAAILASQILALTDERLAAKLKEHREAMKKWVLEDSRNLKGE